MSASLSLGDVPPFALAACALWKFTCTQDRRLWIWIYPWISTQKSVDMDMDMDGKFHIHGKPGYCVKSQRQKHVRYKIRH